ncbi:unnamed protein product [marine sediment metagenome]|uniref:DUF7352 domain-containing protein n=1 Tax=marine sediment metagenome TaxID=412755 RepID=X1RBJ7_9ZZZZ
MKTIHKFPLQVADLQEMKMPKDSTILTVQVQKGTPCLWALVDTDKETEDRFIRIIGTGHSVPENVLRYIGTFQALENNWFVGHVFEVKGG